MPVSIIWSDFLVDTAEIYHTHDAPTSTATQVLVPYTQSPKPNGTQLEHGPSPLHARGHRNLQVLESIDMECINLRTPLTRRMDFCLMERGFVL